MNDAKEESIKSKFAVRYQQELTQINNGLTKKGGIKKKEKVWERIGRIKQKYPGINKHYQIDVIANDKGNATEIQWKQNPISAREGKYLLRTNLDEKNEHTQWMIYNTIREIESTFRTLKTDLDLRPIYHKNDDSTMAHLHLGILAYWLVNTIRHQLKKHDINSDWSEIVRIGNTQKIITTSGQNTFDEVVSVRKSSEPEEKLKQLFDILKTSHKPIKKIKSVVHKHPPRKTQPPRFHLLSG